MLSEEEPSPRPPIQAVHMAGGGGLSATVETTCRVWPSSTYMWPVQPRSQVFIFLLIDFRVSCHRRLVTPTPQL